MNFVLRNARLLTLEGPATPRRGADLGQLGVVPRGDLFVRDGVIAAVGPGLAVPAGTTELDAAGRVVMPGFVDCHTHLCWAGDRLDEWEMKLAGRSYLEILQAGGGIHASVRGVRATPAAELARLTRGRLDRVLRTGTTTVEVKSGYGLDAATELKMLHAIASAGRDWPGQVVPTALIAHAAEGDEAAFVERTLAETLPAVSRDFPGVTIDAFCEQGAWPRPAVERLFHAARAAGHPLRVHADQFNRLGMLEAAIALGARSVDHLEATSPEGLARLAASGTFGVILPVTGFHTDGRYANARALVDAGGALAVATNWNPGSAPSGAMPFALALAVRHNRLTVAEAIAAATINPALLLGLTDRGRLAPGCRADLLLLHHTDERQLAHEVGDNPVARVWVAGWPVA
jgi:imidazolonepropionase